MKVESKVIELKMNCAMEVADISALPKDVSNKVRASVIPVKADALVTEKFIRDFDGEPMVHTYSRNHRYIIQNDTDEKYIDAIDPESCGRTYRESDEELPEDVIIESVVNSEEGDK